MMLNSLYLANLPSEYQSSNLEGTPDKKIFSLKTCQRWLLAGVCANTENIVEFTNAIEKITGHQAEKFTFYSGKEAYQFLLEIVCGLHSRLIGENEIVKQFKDAYRFFLQEYQGKNDALSLLPVLEKILQDTKKVRSQILKDVGQHSYASIAHKLLQKEGLLPVLILGSGKLADELLSYFTKKRPVFISARNDLQREALARKYSCKIVEWNDKKNWMQFPHILNTIGVENFTFLDDESFFQTWTHQHHGYFRFIDFGKPISVQTKLQKPIFYGLQDIFDEGAISHERKMNKIESARKEILQLSEMRRDYFSQQDTLNATSHESMIKPHYATH